MATISHIPNPISVSVKTAGYTIPADRYARAIVECDSGGIVTIDGVNAITTSPFINVDQSATSTTTYSVPTGYKFTAASMGSSGASTINSFNGNTSASYTSGAGLSGQVAGASVGPGGSATAALSGNTCQVSGVAVPSNATHRQAELFLPAGTVLSGSGNWRAVVEEYGG